MATVGQLVIEEYDRVEGSAWGNLPNATPKAITVYTIDDTTPATAHTFNTAAAFVILTSNFACWVKMAAAPTAAADTDDNRFLPANVVRAVPISAAKLSAIGEA